MKTQQPFDISMLLFIIGRNIGRRIGRKIYKEGIESIAMTNTYVTTLSKANSTSNSLRTTVPSSIRKHFNLKDGDKLGWHFDAKDGKIFVVVKPIWRNDNGR